jgi:hypothetical protein
MRKGRKFLNDVLSTFNEIDSERTRLSKEIQIVDRNINDIYHELELMKFGTVQAYKIMIKLQELLRKRRDLKREYLPIQRLSDTIKGNKIMEKMITAQKSIDEVIDRESVIPEDRGVIKSILRH